MLLFWDLQIILLGIVDGLMFENEEVKTAINISIVISLLCQTNIIIVYFFYSFFFFFFYNTWQYDSHKY